jgi:hypothetical protein
MERPRRAQQPDLHDAILRRIGADDVLVVTRLDRLARSTRDLLNVLAALCAAGAGKYSRARMTLG